jgi:hypothetical protein
MTRMGTAIDPSIAAVHTDVSPLMMNHIIVPQEGKKGANSAAAAEALMDTHRTHRRPCPIIYMSYSNRRNHFSDSFNRSAPSNTLNNATLNLNTFSNTLHGASNSGSFANTSNGSALPNSNIFNSNTCGNVSNDRALSNFTGSQYF